ncbi:hypothetical protein ApDm4_0812 [Acetobacter pomorum]|nr:hypothetical protein ApDm4_0812 [Acetobacter pomorum]
MNTLLIKAAFLPAPAARRCEAKASNGRTDLASPLAQVTPVRARHRAKKMEQTVY